MKRIVLVILSLILLVGYGEASTEPGLGHVDHDPAFLARYETTVQEKALLTSYFNWADQGKVTPAKNQSSCGSCWAFATAGMMESQLLIEYGVERDIAEQYLVSCNDDSGNNCCGGNSTILEFLMDMGFYYESDFPYGNGDPLGPRSCAPSVGAIPCIEDLGAPSQYAITDIHVVSSTPSQLKNALTDHGPLYVWFSVYTDFFSYWSSDNTGPYVHTSGTLRGGHAVLLIGYDDDEGCWILKNSWGENEGPFGDGTFKIAYEANCSFGGGVYCDIESVEVNQYEVESEYWTLYPGDDFIVNGEMFTVVEVDPSGSGSVVIEDPDGAEHDLLYDRTLADSPPHLSQHIDIQ